MAFLLVHGCLIIIRCWTYTAIMLSLESVCDRLLPKNLFIDRRAKNWRKHSRNMLLYDHVCFLVVWVLVDEYLCLSRMWTRPVFLVGIVHRCPIFARISLQDAAIILHKLNTDKILLDQCIYLVLLHWIYQRIEDILCVIAHLMLVLHLLLHLLLLLFDPVSVPRHNIFLGGLRRPPNALIELIGQYRTANLLISLIV